MTLVRLRSIFSALFIALVAGAVALAAPKPGTWKGYVVTDAATGNILAESNANLVTPPASMTKLMTFAVLSDKLREGRLTLDTPIRITDADYKMGGTQVFLDPSETFTAEDLIYAMMIQSANDAAHALARFSAGSVEAFVAQMNAKAKELGMDDSRFRTPHGLPPSSRKDSDGDLTTPADFAKLCRYLVQKTDVIKYTSVRERDFGSARAKGPLKMINHNKLLASSAGVDGLKTGYTKNAGYCLSATSQRDGKRVIVVIMGCFGPDGLIDRGASRDRKAIELIDAGFAALPADSPVFVSEYNPSRPAALVPSAVVPTPVTPAPAASAGAPQAKPEEPMVKFVLPSR